MLVKLCSMNVKSKINLKKEFSKYSNAAQEK